MRIQSMKAGLYYVGDLCYVMSDRWDEFCDITIDGHTCLNGQFNMKDGTRFASHSTLYGDGCYKDQDGKEYCVDAGLIGCILFDDITDPKATMEHIKERELGHLIQFDEGFTTSSDEEGVIQFGHIIINTGYYEDEDEDEWG